MGVNQTAPGNSFVERSGQLSRQKYDYAEIRALELERSPVGALYKYVFAYVRPNLYSGNIVQTISQGTTMPSAEPVCSFEISPSYWVLALNVK